MYFVIARIAREIGAGIAAARDSKRVAFRRYSQQKRLRILDSFRTGKTPVVVATDVAARGIHVDALSHVINYDLPDNPEDYVHRIVARAEPVRPGSPSASRVSSALT